MLTRKLGKSEIEVSAMGMGCWAIGGPWSWSDGRNMGWGEVDDAESIRAIQRALDLGITFFDTAANYGCGHSEEILGRAIAGRRDKVVIATKFGHLINETTRVADNDDTLIIPNVRQDCENSLRRLGTDYIDVYQLHEGHFDPDEALILREVLESLVAEGKIRAYGWSTDQLDRARAFGPGEHCASIQHLLNVLADSPEMLALCDEFNLASINKSPFRAGLILGKFDQSPNLPKNDWRSNVDPEDEGVKRSSRKAAAIREIFTSGGRTASQGALAWIWARHPRTIPIPGFRTVKQVEENAGALRFGPLTEAEMSQIAALLAEIESSAA